MLGIKELGLELTGELKLLKEVDTLILLAGIVEELAETELKGSEKLGLLDPLEVEILDKLDFGELKERELELKEEKL